MVRWTFSNKLKWSMELNEIVNFYLFNTPVDNVSVRGKTFKQLGWNKKRLTPLLKKI